MKCQNLFSWECMISLSSAEFAQRAVMVLLFINRNKKVQNLDYHFTLSIGTDQPDKQYVKPSLQRQHLFPNMLPLK